MRQCNIATTITIKLLLIIIYYLKLAVVQWKCYEFQYLVLPYVGA